jgi:aldose 1-epimerase
LAEPQVVVASESVEAVLLPARGARLHRLRAFGQDLLRTPERVTAYDREPFFWGSYVMAPWCNRIQAGSMRLGGQQVSVDANFPDGSAIHGQVHRLPWELDADGTFRVQAGGNRWPWRYEVQQTVTAFEHRLRFELSVQNLSNSPMPGGIGIHPWFRSPVDVAISGTHVFSPNSATPPEPVAVAGEYNLRTLRPMPDELDATWTGLGEVPVTLRWATRGVEASLQTTSKFVVATSPSSIDAVAVEPQTHAPQGDRRLRLGEPGALELIGPGQVLRLDVELRFEPVGCRT